MLRGPNREAGVISSGPWSKDDAFPVGDVPAATSALMRRKRRRMRQSPAVAEKRGNSFKSVRGLNESQHVDLKRGQWAQSKISKRRKSLREERILNRSGQGAATLWILIGSAASEQEHSTCGEEQIFTERELVNPSAEIGQNRTLKIRKSDLKLGY